MAKEKLVVNSLYHYAESFRKHITEETEIEKIDQTRLLFDELLTIVKSGELINININAPPTSGKSVTGMAIANYIMTRCYGRKLNLTDIDRDQQEFSSTLRNPRICDTVRVIDEWNELETTGENSSTEQALYDYFSDVMAQRNVHKISCSPTSAPDNNALIFLEVISTDKKKMINYCKLFYKTFSAGMEMRQLLGFVRVNVKDILAEKWYEEYRKRKFEKMDLILKEGIFRPRVLQYAKIIKNVVEKLKKLTKVPNILNPNIIRNYVKMECRKEKVPQSIVGEELATREVSGILDLYKSYYRMVSNMKKLDKELKKAIKDGDMIQCEIIKKQIEEAGGIQKEIMHAAEMQEEELKHYQEINEKYNVKLE